MFAGYSESKLVMESSSPEAITKQKPSNSATTADGEDPAEPYTEEVSVSSKKFFQTTRSDSVDVVILMQGFLMKKSPAFLKGWQTRTFRLYEHALLYSDPMKWNPQPKQCIKLNDIQRFEQVDETEFIIVSGSKSHHLKAPDEDSATCWLQSIQHARKLDHQRRSRDTFTQVNSVPILKNIYPDGSKRISESRRVSENLQNSPEMQGHNITHVDPSLFVLPLKPLGVSGGTAAFYHLELSSPSKSEQTERWVAKDLAHAMQELDFYEQAAELLRKEPHDWPLLEFMFEYMGVIRAPCLSGQDSIPRQRNLMVMQNLFAGKKKLRLVDLKMGSHTAAGGWMGKSHFAAFRNGLVDSHTSSVTYGFRMEGFDGEPISLRSIDPLLDLGKKGSFSAKEQKKARRLMFQRMEPQMILMYFYDLHSLLSSAVSSFGENFLAHRLSPAEYTERAQLQILEQIASVRRSVHNLPCAQKWIGSSVALHLESAELPVRDASMHEPYGKQHGQVNIFDFGRSELNTRQHHQALCAKERLDRQTFWDHYASGVDRLLWEAARIYFNRYILSDFNFIHIDFFDYDSLTENDFLGSVTIPLDQDAPKKGLSEDWQIYELPLYNSCGTTMRINNKDSTATIEVRYMVYPEPSKFAYGIQVRVVSAQNLRPMDNVIKAGLRRSQKSSDPFALISVGRHGETVGNHMKDAEKNGKRLVEMAVPKPLVGGSLDADIILKGDHGLTWTTEQGPVLEQTLNPDWGRDDASNPPLEFASHEGDPDKTKMLLNTFQAVLRLNHDLGIWQDMLPPGGSLGKLGETKEREFLAALSKLDTE